jgi:hypothetical protein
VNLWCFPSSEIYATDNLCVWLESIEGTNDKLGVQVQDVLLQESAGEVGG